MRVNNLFSNDDAALLEQNEQYGVKILQYNRDLSVTPEQATKAYFAAKF